VNLHGKRILVTGVSAGLGVETAPSLAAHGAQVVGAARNLTKVKAAPAQVLKEAASPCWQLRAGCARRGVQVDEKRAIRGSATASVFLATHHPLSRIHCWTCA
jgi:NAD(P)-dependent dehydrogenase (short-subunit alcohol dehydrogenase family)